MATYGTTTIGKSITQRITFISPARMLESVEKYSRPFPRQIPDASNLCGFLHRLELKFPSTVPTIPTPRLGARNLLEKVPLNIEKAARGDAY